MTACRIPMPAHVQPWTCDCGATAPLPMPVTWAAWEATAEAHLHAGHPSSHWHTQCPDCGDWFHVYGMGQHRAHRHPPTAEEQR